MSKSIHWGILGTSFISGVIAEAISSSESGVVSAIASRSLATAEQFATKHSIKNSYGDYESLINDPEIDVVYIGLPTHLHAEWVMRCARAGKHILCEKPFTVNTAQAQQALEVVRQARVFCMEAQMYRCHPLITQLKDIMQEQPIGTVLAASSMFSDKILELANPTAGGSIMDLGCYPISLMRLLLGEPLVNHAGEFELSAKALFDHKRGVDTEAVATFTFAGPCLATIKVSNQVGLYWDFHLFGTEGTLAVSNLWDPKVDNVIFIQRYGNSTPELIAVSSKISFYTDQINVVNRHVIQGDVEAKTPAMDWNDTLCNMKVLDAWRAAIKLEYQVEAIDFQAVTN